MSSDGRRSVGYKTHILIGVRPDGIMTVIADWASVPHQTEVQKQIDATREPYEMFVLSTPTSIMPGNTGNSRSRSGGTWESGRSSGRW
jgi:hypothetical protein